MILVYKLARYSLKNDLLDWECEIPAPLLEQVKSIVGISSGDDGIEGDWRLTADQVKEIGRILGTDVDPVGYEYYLEPYAQKAEAKSRLRA